MTEQDELSKLVITVIEKTFPASECETVAQILREECSTKLPLAYSSSYERIHLAILKISAGKTDKFLEAAKLARVDWRDVLMWAEFGNDLEAHLKWAKGVCSRCEG